jgi:hypothetical protein
VDCFETRRTKHFFPATGDLEFDLPAAAFYLLSRYEEYLPHRKDNYGRFSHEDSLASREGFLKTPLVNEWLDDFKKKLQLKFPQLKIRNPSFSFLPTYDIDIAYSYRDKGWLRTGGGLLKALARGDFKEIDDRLAVLYGSRSDPYDSYSWLDQLHAKAGLNPFYFFHVGGKTSRFDKNISPSKPAMRNLISVHAGKYNLGIHPSWRSGDHHVLLEEEKSELEKISGQKIVSSRFHYLRFDLPSGYRRLIEAGIKHDYSMGYGTINGFRASVASSFLWYDLEKETETELRLHPFCFMDANSIFEQKDSPLQAYDELQHLSTRVRSVGGNLITIWHNTFLGTDKKFAAWRDIYEKWITETAAVIQ